MTIPSTKALIRVFACGGAGMNIGHKLERYRQSTRAGFGNIQVTYVDTSTSNSHSAVQKDNSYILDGMDGSGKIRSENHEAIGERVKDILQQFKPGNLTIVLSSAAGGSGSVIAPLLTSELLERGEEVVVIMIGSLDTRVDAENTLKTMKSYESIAKKRKMPVVAYCQQNSRTNPRAKVDQDIEDTIDLLASLFSRENRELDSKDLANFLNYPKNTSFSPQLAALTIITDPAPDDSLGNVITVATLANKPEEAALDFTPEVQYTGYFPSDSEMVKVLAHHYLISDGLFHTVAAELNKFLSDLGEQQAARLKKNSILDKGDESTDEGMVF